MGIVGFIIRAAIIIFVLFLLILSGTLVYLYYFYTFQTIRICAPEQTSGTNVTCTSNQECLDYFKSNSPEINAMATKFNDAPEKIRNLQQSFISSTFICEDTCKVRQLTENSVRGMDPFSKAPPCNVGEVELAKADIKGRDIIPIMKYMKNNPGF